MIIARYLTKEVITTFLGVTFILLFAILSQQVVRYLNYIAIGKIPTNVLLELVSFETPYILSFLLPLGLYLSILLVYGRLYAENEMAIMQMYGYGKRRLLRLTLFIAFVTAIFVFILMAWINPFVSVKKQQLMSSDEAALHLVQTLIPGRFQVSPDGSHVMYVEKLSRDHARAENVFLAEEKKISGNEDSHEWMLVLAGQGYQAKDISTQEPFFVTENGHRYEGVPGHNDYKVIQFKKYAIRIPESNNKLIHEENETLSMAQLWNDYSQPKRASEFQWRISLCIMAFVLAVLAVPLSTVRPRQSRFISLVPAVLIYLIYFNLLYVARRWLDQGMIPVSLGLWWVHGVMFLLAVSILFLKDGTAS